MKCVCILLLSCFLMLSCKPKVRQTTQEVAIKQVSPHEQSAENIKKFYQGVWIKNDYLQKIQKSRSVLASVDLVTGITGMQIDTARITGDSLLVPVGWDNHNPGILSLKFEPGKNPQLLRFGKNELEHAVLNGDTIIILHQIYQGVVYKTPYRKVMKVDPDQNVSYAMNFAVNSVLIAGSYTLTNDKYAGHPVVFLPNGSVTGLANFSKYVIENDLKYKPLNNLDIITFDVFTNKQQAFSYVFNNNTLQLYEVKPNAKATLMVLGKLKYTLRRVD